MKQIWIIIIAVVLTGGLVGGGTYYVVNSKATKDKDALQAKIDDLNQKLTDIEKVSAETQTTEEVASQQTAAQVGETADWKTYENSTYKFSIKYPKSYTAKDWASTIKSGAAAEANKNLLSYVGFGANSKENDNEFSVTITNKSWSTELELLGLTIPNVQRTDYTLSGLEGIKAVGNGSVEGEDSVLNYESYLVANSGFVYKISWNSSSEMTKDQFEEAVQTFAISK